MLSYQGVAPPEDYFLPRPFSRAPSELNRDCRLPWRGRQVVHGRTSFRYLGPFEHGPERPRSCLGSTKSFRGRFRRVPPPKTWARRLSSRFRRPVQIGSELPPTCQDL